MYLLKTPGNPTIEISQDQLRSLLGEIEAELHRSQVYRRVVAALQNMLGASAEQAKILVKAVSREAIGLAFQQFSQQPQQVANITQPADTDSVSVSSPSVEQENSSDLLQCFTSVKLHSKKTSTNINEDALPSVTKPVVNKYSHPVDKSQQKSPQASQTTWFNLNKKSSSPELAKQIAAEQRLESIRQIGQQLQKARESRGMTLNQLVSYTLIPVHHMEAIENGNLKSLPEDVFVRGFIRIMGNVLGLNGTALAASLPTPDAVKSVLPSWYQSKNTSGGIELDIRPMHLYLGYATLVAGAVGGLSFMSQQANTNQTVLPDADIQPSSSVSQSSRKMETTIKPGLKSSQTGVVVGPDISPPEAL
jgi:ribosome-binding protein aMBF1 (putative translation factor)